MALTPAEQDLSWSEVARLSTRYLKIPAVLLLVEIIYRLLTLPRNTLAWLQVAEAHLWHWGNLLFYGPNSSELAQHRGWTTRVTLVNPAFPSESVNRIPLYVSDECAGVHEIVFFAALVALTDGVSSRVKRRTIYWMSGLLMFLNMVRLLVLYPIAVAGCTELPGDPNCILPMEQFHRFVYAQGTLILLVGIWLVWFIATGAGQGAVDLLQEPPSSRAVFVRRKPLPTWSICLLLLSAVLLAWSAQGVYLDEEAANFQAEADACLERAELSPNCAEVERAAKDVGWRAASLTAISIGLVPLALYRYHSPVGVNEEE